MWFFVFNSVFNFFLVKINKLIFFFNLDADVAFFNVKIKFIIIILIVLFAM